MFLPPRLALRGAIAGLVRMAFVSVLIGFLSHMTFCHTWEITGPGYTPLSSLTISLFSLNGTSQKAPLTILLNLTDLGWKTLILFAGFISGGAFTQIWILPQALRISARPLGTLNLQQSHGLKIKLPALSKHLQTWTVILSLSYPLAFYLRNKRLRSPVLVLSELVFLNTSS